MVLTAANQLIMARALEQVGSERRERLNKEYLAVTSQPQQYLDDMSSDLASETLTSFTGLQRRRRRQRIASRAADRRNIEDEINNIEVEKLFQLFNAADTDGTGQLTEDKFVNGFRYSEFGAGKSNQEMRELFARIDANANGSIDWDEFSMYLLLGSLSKQQEHQSMFYVKQDYPEKPIPLQFRHKDLIQKIVPDTKYLYTYGLEGSVRKWDRDTLTFVEIIYETRPQSIIDMILVEEKNSTKLVILGLDRTLHFYDCQLRKFVRSLRGKNEAPLDSPREVITKEILRRRGRPKRKNSNSDEGESEGLSRYIIDRLALPPVNSLTLDSQREIFEYELLLGFLDTPTALLHSIYNDRDLYFIGTQSGRILCFDLTLPLDDELMCDNVYAPIQNRKLHRGYVTDIIIDNVSERCIVSSSLDGTISIVDLVAYLDKRSLHMSERRVLGSGTKKKSVRIQHGHSKGVFKVLWSQRYKMLISCGLDRTILFWNPLISKIIDRVEDSSHTRFVDIHLNETDGQLISVSSDNTFKVWDLSLFKCVQTIESSEETRTPTALLDLEQRRFVTATTFLQCYVQNRLCDSSEEMSLRHKKPLVAVLYNEKTQQCITADERTVCVWDIGSGEQLRRFHFSQDIIAMCFDDSLRRLVVSHPGGVITLYNIHNGGQLRSVKAPDGRYVLSVCYASREQQGMRLIIGGGRGRMVYLWDDSDDDSDDRPIQSLGPLNSDIVSIAFCAPYAIAVGQASGHIALFDIPTGAMRSQSQNEHLEPSEFSYIETLLCLPQKQLIVSAQGNGWISFWDLRNLSACMFSLRVDDQGTSVTSLACSETNDTLVLGDFNGRITIFDLSKIPSSPTSIESSQVRRVLSGKIHQRCIVSLGFIPGRNLVVTASDDCSSHLIDLFGLTIGVFGQEKRWDISNPLTYGKQTIGDIAPTTSLTRTANFTLQQRVLRHQNTIASIPLSHESKGEIPKIQISAADEKQSIQPAIEKSPSRGLSPRRLEEKFHHKSDLSNNAQLPGHKGSKLTTLTVEKIEPQIDLDISQKNTGTKSRKSSTSTYPYLQQSQQQQQQNDRTIDINGQSLEIPMSLQGNGARVDSDHARRRIRISKQASTSNLSRSLLSVKTDQIESNLARIDKLREMTQNINESVKKSIRVKSENVKKFGLSKVDRMKKSSFEFHATPGSSISNEDPGVSAMDRDFRARSEDFQVKMLGDMHQDGDWVERVAHNWLDMGDVVSPSEVSQYVNDKLSSYKMTVIDDGDRHSAKGAKTQVHAFDRELRFPREVWTIGTVNNGAETARF